jgi:hypothetical protein
MNGVVVAYVIRTLPVSIRVINFEWVALLLVRELAQLQAIDQFTPYASLNGNRASFTVVAKDNDTGLMGVTSNDSNSVRSCIPHYFPC